MKKIGEGWQYTVYDLENSRVYKKYNSWVRSCWIIIKDCFPHRLEVIWRIPKYIPSLKLKAFHSFELLKKKDLPPSWFGNPTFLNALDYEQDKLVPLHVAFKRLTKDESKKKIDAFIAFAQKLLEYGIVDKFFNIAKNFGINNDGQIILTDIGELVDDPVKIAKLQSERIWAVDYKSRSIEDKELREYFISKMDRHFSLQQ